MAVVIALILIAVGSIAFHVLSPWWWTISASISSGKRFQCDRVLTQDELRRLWQKFGDDATDRALKLLLLLGQRRSEVAKAPATELRDDTWQIPADRSSSSHYDGLNCGIAGTCGRDC